MAGTRRFTSRARLVTKPLGLYINRVLNPNGRTWLDPVLRPLERLTYWVFSR